MSDDESFYSARDSSVLSDLSDSFFDEPYTLKNSLQSSLDSSHLSFNVCHLNAQSIPSHYSELLDTFSSTSNIHAILISESWLKPSLPSLSYSLPGYKLLRNDRTGKGGGGVAIYLRSDISFSVISSSPSLYSASCEYLFLEVHVGRAKAALGVVYCPPATDYFSNLELALESLSSQYTHHIIMGDFNTDLVNHSSRSTKLLNLVASVNFTILSTLPTHHNINTPDSLIDIIITSSPSHVIKHGTISAPGFSRHDCLYLCYKLKPPKLVPQIIWMRCFASMDHDALANDVSNIDFSPIVAAPTVDDKISLLNNAILKLYDLHAPLKAIKLKRPPAPWITRGVRMAMTRRDRAFRKFKRDRSDENWRFYKTARNRCNQMVRAAKRTYFAEQLSDSSSAEVWKFLKTLGVGRCHTYSVITSFSLDDLNTHFSASSSLCPKIKSESIFEIISRPQLDVKKFFFSPVTVDETTKIISSIKSKAVGYDDVSRSMVVSILPHLIHIITHIINTSLSTGVFPSIWRKAFITPLPKVPDPCHLNNFRPISILPFLSKILEAAVHKQVSSFIFDNNLLSPFQSGFRPGHSTTTALLKVIEDVREGMENKLVTVLVLIDFSNAFNMVNHDILLTALQYYKFSSTVLYWFSSYLQGRQQAVRVDRTFSDWCNLTNGVPQGGILSPLLFSLYINFLTFSLDCSYHLYADDLQIYTQANVNNINDAVRIVNANLMNVSNWSHRYGITVNPSKCQAIIIGSSRQLAMLDYSSISPVTFEGSTVPFSSCVKDLGLHVDSTLSWTVHVNEICRSVFARLRTLNRLRNFLPIKVKITLIQALILPIVDYADVCCTDINEEHLNKLERLINYAIRFIFCLRKFDHISSYRRQLKWLPIRERRQVRLLSTLFSILSQHSTPGYLKQKFQYLYDSHERHLRSSNSLALTIPLHRSSFMSNSFAIHATRLWNTLPDVLRKACSQQSFKTSVKSYFLENLQ